MSIFFNTQIITCCIVNKSSLLIFINGPAFFIFDIKRQHQSIFTCRVKIIWIIAWLTTQKSEPLPYYYFFSFHDPPFLTPKLLNSNTPKKYTSHLKKTTSNHPLIIMPCWCISKTNYLDNKILHHSHVRWFVDIAEEIDLARVSNDTCVSFFTIKW